MPFQIDQEALDSPSLKILDINKPPTKNMAHQEFPKMVYLHPKDKTKEHRIKIVDGTHDLDHAQKQGYKTTPHVPEAPPEDLSGFDLGGYEVEEKRGPGRPAKAS